MNPDDELAKLIAARRQALQAPPPPTDDLSGVIAQRRAALATPPAAPEAPGRAVSALSGLAQGATLGFADEALGAVEGANQFLHGGSFSKGYQEGRDKVRAGDKAAAEAHGGYHLAGELAGGVIPFAAPYTSLGGRVLSAAKPGVAKLAALGAGIGGVAGFGSAQGDPYAQTEGAVGGALTGAVAGPLLHGAGKLAGKAVDAIGRSRVAEALPSRFSPLLTAAQQARRALIEKLRAGGMSVSDAMDEASLPVHQGQPTTIADIGGDEVARMARGVQTKPKTSAAIRDPFTARQREQLARIKAEGSNSLGLNPENVQQLAADKMTEAQTASKPFFDAVDAHGAVDDPAITSHLQRPLFKQGYRDAVSMGETAEPQYKPVRTTSTTTETKPIEMDGVPLLDPKGQPKTYEVTNTQETEVPTAKLLHRTKLNMDDHLSGARPLNGSGGSGSSDQRDITGSLAAFRNMVRQAVPDYGPALDAYAGPASERGSLLAGGKAMQGEIRPPDIAHAINTTDSRPFFQRGAYNELLQKAGAIGDRNGEMPKDVSHVFNGSPNLRGALTSLFEDKPEFPAFMDALGRESKYSKTASDILGGSPTANKLEDVAGLTAQPGMDLREFASMATGHVTGLLRGLLGAAKNGQHEYADQVAQQLAPMLTAGIKNPEALKGLLTELQRFQPTLQRRQLGGDALRKLLAARLGSGAGEFIAP